MQSTPPMESSKSGKCRTCSGVFAKNAPHHVYCSGICRQQAYRDRNAREGVCRGCGEGIKNRLYCSDACGAKYRRWQKSGRLLKCHNPSCPRHAVAMVHNWQADAQAWHCNGCGQLRYW